MLFRIQHRSIHYGESASSESDSTDYDFLGIDNNKVSKFLDRRILDKWTINLWNIPRNWEITIVLVPSSARFEVPLIHIPEPAAFARSLRAIRYIPVSRSRFAFPPCTPGSQLCLNIIRLFFMINRDSVIGWWGNNKITVIVKKNLAGKIKVLDGAVFIGVRMKQHSDKQRLWIHSSLWSNFVV